MSTPIPPDDMTAGPDIEGVAAAEYVLGLMSPEEERAFLLAMQSDPDIEQDVAAWSQYFATYTETIPEVTPPPALIRRIEAQAFGERRLPWWRHLLPYGLGAVIGAALVWVVIASGLMMPGLPELRADLAPVEGDIALTARFDPNSGVLAIDQLAGDVPSDRVLELWLIADASAAPISLGLLARGGGTVMALPPLLAERLPGATLAVSEEPAGGSTTGAPTGPVRAAGQLAIL